MRPPYGGALIWVAVTQGKIITCGCFIGGQPRRNGGVFMHRSAVCIAFGMAVCLGFMSGPVGALGANRDSDIEKNIAREFKMGVEEPPDELPPAAAAPAAPDAEALGKELAEARKEIARLQDIVKRILEANRREKVDMHYNVGCVFRSGGQYLKAEQEFLKALALAPDDADVHYNLGILYEENLKDMKKARSHYERYIELAPKEKDAAKVRQWLTEMGM